MKLDDIKIGEHYHVHLRGDLFRVRVEGFVTKKTSLGGQQPLVRAVSEGGKRVQLPPSWFKPCVDDEE